MARKNIVPRSTPPGRDASGMRQFALEQDLTALRNAASSATTVNTGVATPVTPPPVPPPETYRYTCISLLQMERSNDVTPDVNAFLPEDFADVARTWVDFVPYGEYQIVWCGKCSGDGENTLVPRYLEDPDTDTWADWAGDAPTTFTVGETYNNPDTDGSGGDYDYRYWKTDWYPLPETVASGAYWIGINDFITGDKASYLLQLQLRGGTLVTNGGATGGTVGPPGEPGIDGTDGTPGAAATIAVASTTTGSPGTSASVTNIGSSSATSLAFVIPRGDVGATGPPGSGGLPITGTPAVGDIVRYDGTNWPTEAEGTVYVNRNLYFITGDSSVMSTNGIFVTFVCSSSGFSTPYSLTFGTLFTGTTNNGLDGKEFLIVNSGEISGTYDDSVLEVIGLRWAAGDALNYPVANLFLYSGDTCRIKLFTSGQAYLTDLKRAAEIQTYSPTPGVDDA